MVRGFVVALLVLLFIGAGCSPCKMLSTSQRDSVRVEIVERRVIVRDTVKIEIPKVEQQVVTREELSLLTNDYAASRAAIQPDGSLYHSLETIPQQLQAPLESAVEVRDSIIYKERLVTQIVEVERKLSDWQRMQIFGFWVLALFVGALIYLK
ncbi:MAG: hypothetical protein R3Y44_03505 [Rikenellaceae bacterium]